ncbi:MAG: hypothetical protein JWM19_7051 [Actinomycetia bacterium]|nr:hypothetical protein [Actinomycetes bacterium]
MSDASDRLRELGRAGVRMLPARELLGVIGELFVELMPVEADEATADDRVRAALMRAALAEVTERAGRLCPLVCPVTCSCGETFATAGDLDEHFGEVFVPADDMGLDGKAHAELYAPARMSTDECRS